MTVAQSAAKSLESPLLVPEDLSVASSTDALGAAAAMELAALLAEERSVTARYWRLGQLLSWARKPLTHGQWGVFLKHWKIDKTRAAKAMRIFRTFPTVDETTGLTVAEAYERSAKSSARRMVKGKKPGRRKVALPATTQSWRQLADAMSQAVEQRIEHPESVSGEEADAALESIERLLGTLRRYHEFLRGRSTAEPPGADGLDTTGVSNAG